MNKKAKSEHNYETGTGEMEASAGCRKRVKIDVTCDMHDRQNHQQDICVPALQNRRMFAELK